MIFFIYIMPKKPSNDANSPKIGNYKLRSRKKKKKELEKKHIESSDDDTDSSSDYDPKEDKMGDMNPRELQRFIQKIFPSKAGKERLNQLDKIDKMLGKKDKLKNKKIKKSKSLKNRIKNKKVTADKTTKQKKILLKRI